MQTHKPAVTLMVNAKINIICDSLAVSYFTSCKADYYRFIPLSLP